MKILIADDEAPARERLSGLIADLGVPYEMVGEAANGEEALVLCESLCPDIVLLDIRMPGLDGIEVAARLSQHQMPPAVIFTTAFEQHALDAFEKNAADFGNEHQ